MCAVIYTLQLHYGCKPVLRTKMSSPLYLLNGKSLAFRTRAYKLTSTQSVCRLRIWKSNSAFLLCQFHQLKKDECWQETFMTYVDTRCNIHKVHAQKTDDEFTLYLELIHACQACRLFLLCIY